MQKLYEIMQFWKALNGSEGWLSNPLSSHVHIVSSCPDLSCVDCSQLQAHLRRCDGSSWLPAKSIGKLLGSVFN